MAELAQGSSRRRQPNGLVKPRKRTVRWTDELLDEVKTRFLARESQESIGKALKPPIRRQGVSYILIRHCGLYAKDRPKVEKAKPKLPTKPCSVCLQPFEETYDWRVTCGKPECQRKRRDQMREEAFRRWVVGVEEGDYVPAREAVKIAGVKSNLFRYLVLIEVVPKKKEDKVRYRYSVNHLLAVRKHCKSLVVPVANSTG